VDIANYQFLAPELLWDVRRAGGYPILRRGLESSVPGLHFLGAPAAWSFGPTMRFVSGSWYAGRALAKSIAGRRPRG
jgi:FAD-dependent urate hydroxylase